MVNKDNKNVPSAGESKILIMRRPSQVVESNKDDGKLQQPAVKSLEQRQAEYQEARLRILGNTEPPEEDNNDDEETSQPSADLLIKKEDSTDQDESVQSDGSSENAIAVCSGGSSKEDANSFVANGAQRGIIFSPIATLKNNNQKGKSSNKTKAGGNKVENVAPKLNQQTKKKLANGVSVDEPMTNCKPSSFDVQQLGRNFQNIRLQTPQQRLWMPDQKQEKIPASRKRQPNNNTNLLNFQKGFHTDETCANSPTVPSNVNCYPPNAMPLSGSYHSMGPSSVAQPNISDRGAVSMNAVSSSRNTCIPNMNAESLPQAALVSYHPLSYGPPHSATEGVAAPQTTIMQGPLHPVLYGHASSPLLYTQMPLAPLNMPLSFYQRHPPPSLPPCPAYSGAHNTPVPSFVMPAAVAVTPSPAHADYEQQQYSAPVVTVPFTSSSCR